jgi:septum site-determining protein MinD
MGEVIVITSGKGGVGKTTTSANIGAALSIFEKKVCLVDTDIGLRNLDVAMGLENRIVYDLVDVIKGRCKHHQALIKDKRFDGLLYLLPAAQTTDKHDVTSEEMKELIQFIKNDYDYIIIDCPAGIEQGFKNAVAGANKAIVVTTPEVSSVRDADRVIGLLEKEKNIEQSTLLINRVRSHLINNGDMFPIDEITEHLGIDLIGVVIDDEEVIKATNKGQPIVLNENNKASIAYQNTAKRILGQTIPLEALEDKKNNMMLRIKKFLKL